MALADGTNCIDMILGCTVRTVMYSGGSGDVLAVLMMLPGLVKRRKSISNTTKAKGKQILWISD